MAKFVVRADCGPSYCGVGRAAGSDFQPAQGLSVYVCIHACMYVCVTTVCIIGREPSPALRMFSAKFFSLVFPDK